MAERILTPKRDSWKTQMVASMSHLAFWVQKWCRNWHPIVRKPIGIALWHDFIFVVFRLSASNETLCQGAGKTTCIAPMLTLLLLGRNTPVLLRHGGNIAVGFGILLKLEVVVLKVGQPYSL